MRISPTSCSPATSRARRRGFARICMRRSILSIPKQREAEMAQPAAMRLQANPSRARAQIAFENVSLVLGGKTIIEQVSLEVAAGEFLCIIGASGCGKTTALRLAAGLYQPTSGRVRFESDDMLAPRRDIAIVFQD